MEQFDHNTNAQACVEQSILARASAAPGNTSILLELQAFYKEHARYEEETAILRHLLEEDLPASEQAEVLHDLVYALYCQSNLEEAIPRAEHLINAYPEYSHLGSVFWLLGSMYAINANEPEHAATWKQDVAAAEANFRRALLYVDDKEERASILVELGTALSIGGKLTEARRTFEQALDSGIEDLATRTLCYQRLGRVLYRMEQVEEAKRYYEQAIDVGLEQPDNSRALACVYLAGLFREQGDIDQAERYCQQAKELLDESNSGASTVLESIYEETGDISFQKGEYQLATDNYQAALRLAHLPEKQDEIYRKLSIVLQWNGRHEHALESLRQALALALSSQPTDEEQVGEILFHMGQSLYSMGDYQKATVVLKQASEKVRSSMLADAHLSLGHSYFRLGRFGDATEFYREALKNERFMSSKWRQALRYLVRSRLGL